MTTAVRLETDVNLVCTATGNPTPNITWDYVNRMNIDIASFEPVILNSTTVQSTLNIPVVEFTDFQDYTCMAMNFVGNASASALLGGVVVNVMFVFIKIDTNVPHTLIELKDKGCMY